MIRELIPEDDPRLRKISALVDWQQQDLTELHELLGDLRETMIASRGIGIAAPQVGVNQRVIIVCDLNHNRILEMINPQLWYSPSRVTVNEACLSFPGRVCSISRAESVICSWNDRHGGDNILLFEGLSAIVLQHEFDHLNGVVIVDPTNTTV